VYFKKTQIENNKNNLSKVFKEISSLINTFPSNSFSCLPKGGRFYLEMIDKYQDKVESVNEIGL